MKYEQFSIFYSEDYLAKAHQHREPKIEKFRLKNIKVKLGQ